MDLEFDGDPERGLHRYVGMVAEALGLHGEGWAVQVEPPASVYLPVQDRLARLPDRDVALLWDERSGWSGAIESPDGTDLTVLRYLGVDVLPAPRTVARFAARLLAGEEPGQPDRPRLRAADDPDDLPGRLAAYARNNTTLLVEEPDSFAIQAVRPHPAVVVLRVSGELDMATAPELDESVDTALRQPPAVLVVDLSAVRFFSSAGLSSLIRTNEAAGERTGVRIVAASPVTRRPLEVTGLTDALDVYPDLEAALVAPWG
jgi:anti-anti-sigma factor